MYLTYITFSKGFQKLMIYQHFDLAGLEWVVVRVIVALLNNHYKLLFSMHSNK